MGERPRVVRMDKAFDIVIVRDAEVEKVADGFTVLRYSEQCGVFDVAKAMALHCVETPVVVRAQ